MTLMDPKQFSRSRHF